jgi:parallel beta-helix repeat protein
MRRKVVAVLITIWIVISSFFAGLIGFGNINVSGTDVSGSISSDTTWTLASSPYFVVGNITVENGVNLTIDPGVEVRFDGYYSIYVEGDLFAVGNGTDRIIFTSNKSTPAPEDWNTIQINSTGWASLRYCDISYGETGISLRDTSGNYISHNNIFFIDHTGIFGWSSSNNTISNNNVTDNYVGISMSFFSDNNTISRNNITSNGATGIGLGLGSNNTVISNNISDNFQGITSDNSIDNIIRDNLISNNGGYGLYITHSNNHIVTGNNISLHTIDGIYLLFTSVNNSFIGNNITENSRGITISAFCSENIFNNNNISDNNGWGIISGGNNNLFYNNEISFNGGGVNLLGAENENFTSNTISFHDSHGLRIESSSNNNNFINNDIFENQWDGFYIRSSSNNNFTGNDITNNYPNGFDFGTSSNNNIINNNISENTWDGIYIHSSSQNYKIINNSIISNGDNGIYSTSPGIEIIGNNFSRNEYGVHLYLSSDSKIIDNDVYRNDYFGIWLDQFCNDSIISNNNISYNVNWSGLSIDQSSNCQIFQNNVHNNEGGIFIGESSSNCTVFNNTVYSNAYGGISVGESYDIIVRNNIVYYNDFKGIGVGFATNATVINNEVFSNYMIGIILSGNFVTYSQNNHILYNNISDNNEGIRLWFAANNTIIGNNVTSNKLDGINVWDSIYNRIEDNDIVLNKERGIEVIQSSKNMFLHNRIHSNEEIGFLLRLSSNNHIIENEFFNDGIVIWGDQLSHFNTHSIPTNNTISGRPIYYHVNASDTVFDGISAGEIILANCTNITVQNLKINNSDCGIELGFTSYTTLSNNIIHSEDYSGIYLALSSYNFIITNNISDSNNGIYLSYSSNNNVYHNNIINNTIQAIDNRNNNAWDDGYPSGGNYWSDYGGFDNFKGPFQDIPGSDGIGDTNYTIDSDSKDNYPLLGPYPDRWLTLDYGWNLISIPAIQTNTEILSVLASLQGQFDAIQFYNNTDGNDHWKHYHISKPSQLNDLMENNHKQGFLIHIINPSGTIFRYDGVEPSVNQTIDIRVGWNMVGYPSLTKHNRTNGLNGLQFGPEIDAIQWFHSSTKTWHFLEEGDHFVPGRGYWFHSKVDTTWEVPL